MKQLLGKLKRFLCRKLYYGFACKLPISTSPRGGKIYQKIRYFFASRIIPQCGIGVNFEHGACFDSDLVIGDYSDVGVNCVVGGAARIGNDVMMGPGCIFYAHNHRFDDLSIPMRLQGFTEDRPVRVGDDVWFGTRVIVMPGVTIGNHCVIGAGSVVTKDVPDYAVVGGAPARILKMRNEN